MKTKREKKIRGSIYEGLTSKKQKFEKWGVETMVDRELKKNFFS